MRADFVTSITSTLVKDKNSVFLTGDLGFAALEELRSRIGDRFLNVGVAEQNMIGVAAGIALQGIRPWVYSIAPFITYRCLEQIRNDVCLHRLPVHLVGNGGGYTYGIMGATHHALEDLAVLKAMPNLDLYFPAVSAQVDACTKLQRAGSNASYLRLAISGHTHSAKILEQAPATLTSLFHDAKGAVIVGVGHAVQVALAAMAKEPNLAASIYSVSRFPFDWDADSKLLKAMERADALILLDEHAWSGSIAESFVAEASLRISLPQITLLTAQYFPGQTYGSARFLQTQAGLTPDAVLQAVRRRRAA